MLTNSISCSNLLSSLNPVTNFKHGITDTFGPSNGICTSPSKLSGLDYENGNSNRVSVTNKKLAVSEDELKHYIRYERRNNNKVGSSITCNNVKSVFRYVICFKSHPVSFLACFYCRRYLDCYLHIVQIKIPFMQKRIEKFKMWS